MSLLMMGRAGNGGAGSSSLLDSGRTFHIYPRRDWFVSFREMFGGTVVLANGSTLSVVRVSTIRFQM
jgi:hypothetical protein